MTTAPYVGPYRLLGRIGEGGMGVVHLAQRDGGPHVALKQLRPHIVGDDESRARLAREVTSLRRVRSARVAEVLDADPWGETPYIVTRYVPGFSLYQKVNQSGPVGGDDLIRIALGLAEALEAVHAVDVLHRDVKPSNVLVEDRSAVLIDFGLARLADDSNLTVSGWLLGTPGYLAPEILYGDEATSAADIHSWAATVVYAGTGRAPYGTGPAVAVMDRVRRREHDLSGVPQALLPLIQVSLSPDPRDRPDASQVRAWLAGRDNPDRTRVTPIMVRPETGEEQAQSSWPPAELGAPAPRIPLKERARRGLVLLALVTLTCAGFVLAPIISGLAVALLVLLLTTRSHIDDALTMRRERRGTTRSDPYVAVASAPWHLLKALPESLGLCLLSLAAGAGTGLLIAGLTTVGWGAPALAASGLVASAVAWFGPLAGRPRSVAQRWVVAVAGPFGQPGLYALAILILAAVVAVLFLVLGTQWVPVSHPPPTKPHL